MNKNKLYIILSWFLVLLWMIVIFFFSAMKSDNSTNLSEGLVSKTIKVSYDVGNKMGIIKDNIDDNKITKITQKVHVPIRKLAHFTEYLILALLVYNALYVSNVDYKKLFLITILICFMYSCSDEIHQLFIDGRSGQIIDICIDSFGSIIGTFIIKKVYNNVVNST